MNRLHAALAVTVALLAMPAFAADYPKPQEGDWTAKAFKLHTGETLPEVRLHYTTIGDPKGQPVLMLHGSSQSGPALLNAGFAGELFGPGQPLDATKYYIILPDGLGHGKSSKPSDGLKMKFPAYTYDDMVKAQYQLVTEHLGVNHLRLVLGTSMGAMHTWVWGYTYPDFMDALMPLASLPVEIAGRNRMMRKLAIDMIEMDPEWKGGEYKAQPKLGLTGAVSSLIFMGSSPL